MNWNETHNTFYETSSKAENSKSAASMLVSALRRLRFEAAWAIMPCGWCVISICYTYF